MAIFRKTELLDSILANWPDNTTQIITPAVLRAEIIKVINSVQTILDGSSIFEYSAIVEYNEGDLVRYSSNVFVKINGAATGITPVDGADWTLLTTNNSFATESVYGITRLATDQETTDGVLDDVAVSPARLNDKVANYVLESRIGANDGVASLDVDGKVPQSQLPNISITDVFVVADITERDLLDVQTGDVSKVVSENKTYIYDGSVWQEITVYMNADDVDDSMTTNKFVTSVEIGKLDNITVTNPINLDDILTDSHAALTLEAGSTTQEAATLTDQELTLNLVTTTTDGLMSQADKTKLDGVEANAKDDQNAEDVPFTSIVSPTRFTQNNVRDSLDELEVMTRNTEFSYTFYQGNKEFGDILIVGVLITEISASIGVNTKEISINGGSYINLINGVSIPNNSEINIRITYNSGYNNGIIAIKGEILI